VEKYLKAFLVFNEMEFGKTHNLELLLEMCRKKDSEFATIYVGLLT